MSDKIGITLTIIAGLFILNLAGCTTYGTKIHVRDEFCYKCKYPLKEKCTSICTDGTYKCKCVNCGRVLEYRRNKVTK